MLKQIFLGAALVIFALMPAGLMTERHKVQKIILVIGAILLGVDLLLLVGVVTFPPERITEEIWRQEPTVFPLVTQAGVAVSDDGELRFAYVDGEIVTAVSSNKVDAAVDDGPYAKVIVYRYTIRTTEKWFIFRLSWAEEHVGYRLAR